MLFFFLNMVPYFIENNFVWLTHTGAFSQRYSQITWNVWQTSFSSEAAVRRCSSKGVLKNFAIFTRKHLFWSFFLIKLQAYRPAALLKRNSNTGVFYEYWARCEWNMFKVNSKLDIWCFSGVFIVNFGRISYLVSIDNFELVKIQSFSQS